MRGRARASMHRVSATAAAAGTCTVPRQHPQELTGTEKRAQHGAHGNSPGRHITMCSLQPGVRVTMRPSRLHRRYALQCAPFPGSYLSFPASAAWRFLYLYLLSVP
jgi:hypothetical protein